MKTIKNVFVSLLLCLLCYQSYAQKTTLLTYNIMKGFEQQKEEKKVAFIDWAKTINPDIICFQELSTFTQSDLEQFALRYGHPHAVILRASGSAAIGITSRYPINNFKKVFNNEGKRGFIHAEINGYHVFTMHLYPSPHRFDLRKTEIQTILREVANIPANKGVILAGDFNAYASVDTSLYCNATRIASDRQTASKIKDITQEQINGIPDFSALKMLTSGGFVDAFWHVNRRTEASFPTAGYDKSKPNRQSRLDYVWLNEALAEKCTKAQIIKNNVTDTLSDHYPVLIELKK